MVNESLFSVLLNLSFLELNLLLFLDLVHIVFSLDSSLLSQGSGFLLELLLSCFLQVSLDPLSLSLLQLFSFSGISLALFKGSLCPKSIDFSLSISSLFLEFSESLDFTLFFFSQSLSFLLLLELSLVLFPLVFGNRCILVLFFLSSPLFLDKGLCICLSSLLHE